MLSISPLQSAKRCAVTLATAGLLIAGFAGSAAAATIAGTPTATDSMMKSTSTVTPGSDSYFAPQRKDDPCTNITALTHRPTVTDAVCVVPKGHVLLEAGYAGSKDQNANARAYVYPSAVLRFGTNIKNLEISVAGPSESRFKDQFGNTSHSLGDSAIGAKYFLGNGKRFAHSVAARLTIPTGDTNGTTNTYNPSGTYNAQYALTDMIGLQASETFTSFGTAPQQVLGQGKPPTTRFGTFTSSLVLSAAIPKIANVFIEDAVYSKPAGAGTSGNQFLGGVSKVISNRLQLDVEYVTANTKFKGSNIAPAATDKTHGFGAGLSFFM